MEVRDIVQEAVIKTIPKKKKCKKTKLLCEEKGQHLLQSMKGGDGAAQSQRPEHRDQHQIDYILCSQRWRSSIQSAKTRLGADYGSDHELLIAKLRLKLKKVGKTTSPFRYELNQSWIGSEK